MHATASPESPFIQNSHSVSYDARNDGNNNINSTLNNNTRHNLNLNNHQFINSSPIDYVNSSTLSSHASKSAQPNPSESNHYMLSDTFQEFANLESCRNICQPQENMAESEIVEKKLGENETNNLINQQQDRTRLAHSIVNDRNCGNINLANLDDTQPPPLSPIRTPSVAPNHNYLSHLSFQTSTLAHSSNSTVVNNDEACGVFKVNVDGSLVSNYPG